MAAPPPDADSQMLSSPSDSDIENNPSNNHQPQTAQTASTLSPPDSLSRATRASNSNMPTANSGTATANSNGKRPLNTISNGDLEDGTRSIDQPRREFALKTHASGYTWDRAEDEPGHAWSTKKAKDEWARALEGMAHRDMMVMGRYGDPFEMAENERAVKESLQKS